MYSTAKKLSGLCAIACAINIMGIILLFTGYPALASHLNINNFPLVLGATMFMCTGALVSLLLTLALRNVCQSLEYEYEGQAKKIHDLDEKIKQIENKI